MQIRITPFEQKRFPSKRKKFFIKKKDKPLRFGRDCLFSDGIGDGING